MKKITDAQLNKAIQSYSGLRIRGGKGDKKHPMRFAKSDLMMGVQVEMEHTKDINTALEIAVDHLSERPDYYRKLKRHGLADELKNESVVERINLLVQERFNNHNFTREDTTYHRATYHWQSGPHQFRAVFHPRENSNGEHHVDVSFGVVHPSGQIDLGARDLGVDPTDTLATMHHCAKDYMKNVVAKHYPETTAVTMHCRPIPGRRDIYTAKDGPDTQRGRSYIKLLRRAVRYDPEMHGVKADYSGEGSKVYMGLNFPEPVGQHFAKQSQRTWKNAFGLLR